MGVLASMMMTLASPAAAETLTPNTTADGTTTGWE
jgi:hypothetical protein